MTLRHVLFLAHALLPLISAVPAEAQSSLRLFGQESPLRRELVEGSMEVHAVPGYGAIQITRVFSYGH